jgi:hypothetical protein
MAMRVDEADQVLEELPPLKRALAVQRRVIEAILVSHFPETPPAEVDARMARMVRAFHGRDVGGGDGGCSRGAMLRR